jgi:hypothetical protein
MAAKELISLIIAPKQMREGDAEVVELLNALTTKRVPRCRILQIQINIW